MEKNKYAENARHELQKIFIEDVYFFHHHVRRYVLKC